jgi:zinc/manganese transport system substrate-binding protein
MNVMNRGKSVSRLGWVGPLSWALAALLPALAPGSAVAKLNVVTTLPSFADIASEVGGERVSVQSLTKGTQDPHFVDAKPDLILKLNRADLLIRGGLGLEDGWMPPLLTGSRNAKIQAGASGDLNASSSAELRDVPQGKIDRAEGDVHPGGNPHFMLDPRNGARLARAVADRLASLDAEHAEEYRKRADGYAKRLEERIRAWGSELKPLLKGKPVVTYHKSWRYFTAWMEIEEVGQIEPKPGIPPRPSTSCA